jgi:lipoate-protein ligase A
MSLLLRVEGARSGTENMAIDRALLRCAETGELGSPLLRIYDWSPPAVSLGYHQDTSALDLAGLQAKGIDLVRRPTGGAAVLHAQEWTYAVAAPRGIPGLGKGFAEIYRSLADAMVEALRGLGIDARSGGAGAPESFVCFEAVQGHEISVQGRKLVGSAFRQTRGAFLQHGSLLRGPGHLDLVEHLLTLDPEQRKRRRAELERRTVHLAELGHAGLAARDFGEAFAEAILRRIGGELTELEEDPPELRRHMPATEEPRVGGRILP